MAPRSPLWSANKIRCVLEKACVKALLFKDLDDVAQMESLARDHDSKSMANS